MLICSSALKLSQKGMRKTKIWAMGIAACEGTPKPQFYESKQFLNGSGGSQGIYSSSFQKEHVAIP